MFKYPLAVTIDTNIFDAAKFNLGDASTLRILRKSALDVGKSKVVLSDIVVRESKRHIAARVKEVCGIVNTARNSALKVYNEHLISSIGME
ncbi:MAG: PIN domain-containing protein [Oscillospiraceae bacterium]